MTKRKQSDFREDRDNNCDLPHLDDVKTVAQQYAYQRPLRKKWDECLDKPPLAMMDLPNPAVGAPWRQFPDHPSPDYVQRQIERQL